jgi:hypothetical protein
VKIGDHKKSADTTLGMVPNHLVILRLRFGIATIVISARSKQPFFAVVSKSDANSSKKLLAHAESPLGLDGTG